MVIACILLAGSGGVRVLAERQLDIAAENARVPLFPLRDLPRTLGPRGEYVNLQGEQELDDKTLQVAGATDYMVREYVDERTGVSITVLVVFGPAELVFPHAPTVCFPAFGYSPDGPARQHLIPAADGGAPFESLTYAKRVAGATTDRVEVFYSYWHNGRWSPTAAETRKQFRHHPEIFKIQVQRRIGPMEGRGDDGPIEDLLGHLVPELERRIVEAKARAAGAAATAESA